MAISKILRPKPRIFGQNGRNFGQWQPSRFVGCRQNRKRKPGNQSNVFQDGGALVKNNSLKNTIKRRILTITPVPENQKPRQHISNYVSNLPDSIYVPPNQVNDHTPNIYPFIFKYFNPQHINHSYKAINETKFMTNTTYHFRT